jgi:hypothetical protein
MGRHSFLAIFENFILHILQIPDGELPLDYRSRNTASDIAKNKAIVRGPSFPCVDMLESAVHDINKDSEQVIWIIQSIAI